MSEKIVINDIYAKNYNTSRYPNRIYKHKWDDYKKCFKISDQWLKFERGLKINKILNK